MASSPVKVHILLVEPSFPSNIGAVARIIENFAFSSLILINPQTDPLQKKARIMALYAEEILEKARVFHSLKEALEGISFSVAFSARERRERISIDSWSLPSFLEEKFQIAPFSSLGLIFGRERNGLTNEEILLANALCYIPLYGKNSSLNLAQAVAIASYEVSKFLHKKVRRLDRKFRKKERRASFEEKDLCVKKTLEILGHLEALSEEAWERRQQGVEDFFSRMDLKKKDVSFYLGFLRKIAKKLDAGGWV